MLTAGRASSVAGAEAPGLFFCGLAFQYAFSSTVLAGVGRDAAYVAKQIDARAGRAYYSPPESSAAYPLSWRLRNGRRTDLTIDRLLQLAKRLIVATGHSPSSGCRLLASSAWTRWLRDSCFLIGDADEAVRTLQAGYQDRIKNGDSLGAVRFAFWLGFVLNTRGEMAVGGGWVARANAFSRANPRTSSTRLPAHPRVLPAPLPW